MNQATNRVPFGLLTNEEKEGFCEEAKKRGMYQVFPCTRLWYPSKRFLTASKTGPFDNECIYQLKILPDEWYAFQHKFAPVDMTDEEISMREISKHECSIGHLVRKGIQFQDLPVEEFIFIRPATPNEIPDEIPKPETLEDRIKSMWSDFEAVLFHKEVKS